MNTDKVDNYQLENTTYSSAGFRIIFCNIFKYIQLLKLQFKRTSLDGSNKKNELNIPLELDTLHIPSSLQEIKKVLSSEETCKLHSKLRLKP